MLWLADGHNLGNHNFGRNWFQSLLFGVLLTVNTLLWANDLTNPKSIKLGTRLLILPVTGVRHEVKKGDKNPIGLILCAHKNELIAKYVLGGLNNKIFAAQYRLVLPTTRQLSQELKLEVKDA